MNAYVTFDSKKYRTPAKTWRPAILPSASMRILPNGSLDSTHGPNTTYIFVGELAADVSPDTGYGSPSDLRTSLAKLQQLGFTDHYGTSYNVVAIGPFQERSLSPNYDSSSNIIYFSVQLKGVKT